MKKMHRILLAAMLLTAASASLPATGAERTMKVTDNYLWMPVSHKFDRARDPGELRFGGNRITVESLEIYNVKSIWEK